MEKSGKCVFFNRSCVCVFRPRVLAALDCRFRLRLRTLQMVSRVMDSLLVSFCLTGSVQKNDFYWASLHHLQLSRNVWHCISVCFFTLYTCICAWVQTICVRAWSEGQRYSNPLRFLIHSTSHPHKHPAATPPWSRLWAQPLQTKPTQEAGFILYGDRGIQSKKTLHHSRSVPSLAAIKQLIKCCKTKGTKTHQHLAKIEERHWTEGFSSQNTQNDCFHWGYSTSE